MLALGLKNLWVQSGILHPEAAPAPKPPASTSSWTAASWSSTGGECNFFHHNPFPKPARPTIRLMTFPALVRRALPAFALSLAALMPAPASAQIVEVGDGGPGPVKAPHLTVELVSLAPQVAVGGQLQIGLSFTIEEKWHVYWVNAGDSGEPPAIKWTLPKGVTAGPLQYPAPQRLPLGPLMDFGYEDQVAFPVTLTVAPKTKPGKIHLDARVSWLVCASQCLPGKAHLGIDLNVVNPPLADPPLVGVLGAAIKGLPQPLPPNMRVDAVGDAKHILLTLHTGKHEADAEFYPFQQKDGCGKPVCDAESVIANAADQIVEPTDDGVRIGLTRAPDLPVLPKTIDGLIKLSDTEAYTFSAPVTPGTVPVKAASKAVANDQVSGITLPSAIGLAFLGGMLLNLMPCVFPVLFLKGLALVNASGEERKRQRAHGLVYTLGILVSFWTVVGVLLALRAGGSSFGWGFQLQSPTFVAVLASLLFFFALSLAGMFDLGLSLTSAGNSLAQKQGYAGSFFTGVLATVVATPCTAPLMGAAVGFALAQSAVVAFAVFTALAFGLALPYLALSWHPQWTSVLPRPGAWMEILKQATAVPLLATVIWLAWVYGSLYAPNGVDREAWLLACFLTLAAAGWVLGRWPAKWASSIAAVALIAFALYMPLGRVKVVVERWQPYTAQSFEAARATGRPVFVDFTAAWCLSCKVNEAAVLNSADIVSKFASSDVILLRADWTQHDDFISNELAKLGRSGVPTYVVYPPGKNSNPDVLPELLTKQIVQRALERDLKPIKP